MGAMPVSFSALLLSGCSQNFSLVSVAETRAFASGVIVSEIEPLIFPNASWIAWESAAPSSLLPAS